MRRALIFDRGRSENNFFSTGSRTTFTFSKKSFLPSIDRNANINYKFIIVRYATY